MTTTHLQTPVTIQRCSSQPKGASLIPTRVPSDVVAAAVRAALDAPDIRADRIKSAVDRLASGPLDSAFLASMIVARITAESL